MQLAAPLLQGLQLGNAQYPGVPHLTSLDLASSCLKEASWRNLPYLESLQLACPALTSLHLACCDALPARALQTFTPTPLHVGCPNLQCAPTQLRSVQPLFHVVLKPGVLRVSSCFGLGPACGITSSSADAAHGSENCMQAPAWSVLLPDPQLTWNMCCTFMNLKWNGTPSQLVWLGRCLARLEARFDGPTCGAMHEQQALESQTGSNTLLTTGGPATDPLKLPRVLHLEMCEQLRSSVLTAAQLRQLTVTSCAELQSLSLSTPQLQAGPDGSLPCNDWC